MVHGHTKAVCSLGLKRKSTVTIVWLGGICSDFAAVETLWILWMNYLFT